MRRPSPAPRPNRRLSHPQFIGGCLLRAVMLAVTLGLLTLGAVRLDERYARTRFEITTGLCPLVNYGNTATPMCRAPGPGW